MTEPTTNRYEVTGPGGATGTNSLPTTPTMPVAAALGRELARAFAPANGAIGKIQATINNVIDWTWGNATDDRRHIRWDQLIQEPIDARLIDGDIQLLAPGEWTVDADVYFDWSNYGGDGWTDVDVHVIAKDGTVIRTKTVRVWPGTGAGSASCRIIDALVEEDQLPATVQVWFGTGKWRAVLGGAARTIVSAKKTTRYATETVFNEDTGGTDLGDNPDNPDPAPADPETQP